MKKRVLNPERLRKIPPQFSWIDHRLARENYFLRCDHPAWALYLFLTSVADAEGLSELYGVEAVARAMEDAFTYQAFSCEYIGNLLQQRQHPPGEPAALHLTRQQDLLELELPAPDLSLYDLKSPPDYPPNPMKDDQLVPHLLYLKLSYFSQGNTTKPWPKKAGGRKSWTQTELFEPPGRGRGASAKEIGRPSAASRPSSAFPSSKNPRTVQLDLAQEN